MSAIFLDCGGDDPFAKSGSENEKCTGAKIRRRLMKIRIGDL